MKYLPEICQSGGCAEINIVNSCNNCCSELAKDPAEITITLEIDDIAESETIVISTEEDLEGILVTFSTEDFLNFSVTYNEYKSVSNITYSLTITTGATVNIFSYVNSGGSWDDVMIGLTSLVNANILYTAIYDGVNILITGSGITEETTIISNSDNIEITGPNNISGDSFPNGVYKITSDITFTDDTTDQMVQYLPYTCSLESCIFTEFANLKNLYDCGCGNKDCIDAVIEAYNKLNIITIRSIENQADITKVEELIEQLELFCENKDCNCNG